MSTAGVRVSGRRGVIPFSRAADVRLRLFCFPYAGGDANLFRDWAAAVPAGVEMLGVQYPGRGPGEFASLIDRCDAMADHLRADLAGWLDVDFAFFGHSNGALISFELARRLSARERRMHRHHFLSARVAAHLPTGRRHISGLPRAEFLSEIGRIGGTPKGVLDDAPLMSLIEPRLRADFALGESYVYRPGPGLSCDCSTLHGVRDALVDGDRVTRWSDLTTGRVRHHVLDGDHFFLNARRPEVLEIVRSTLQQILDAKKVSP